MAKTQESEAIEAVRTKRREQLTKNVQQAAAKLAAGQKLDDAGLASVDDALTELGSTPVAFSEMIERLRGVPGLRQQVAAFEAANFDAQWERLAKEQREDAEAFRKRQLESQAAAQRLQYLLLKSYQAERTLEAIRQDYPYAGL